LKVDERAIHQLLPVKDTVDDFNYGDETGSGEDLLASADVILGWMETAPARIGALTATTVGSVAICFAPRVPALTALSAVLGFWVVAFVKTPKRV
jgi:hypothetical protein